METSLKLARQNDYFDMITSLKKSKTHCSLTGVTHIIVSHNNFVRKIFTKIPKCAK